ncbi:MAG: 30S ribosomal protein S2, partial [Candidatus Nomurabacteria bacterium GW2011_GWB1_37_5]
MTNNQKINPIIEELLKIGAHIGYSKTRRHPSTNEYILSTKKKLDIIDLEKSLINLDKAKEFIKKLGAEGKIILFVGAKPEAKSAIKEAAESLNMP